MEKFANDNLILLEFLVDNVCFEYSVQKSLKCIEGETCVAFQFLDNAPLYVCEEDFAPKNKNYADGCDGCSSIKNGKSCLFALSTDQAQQCMKQFDIYVEVFRKMKPGMLPEKMVLGESLISILNLFQEMVEAYNNSAEDTPIAKTMKDCFKIQNTTGELIGRIGVYIRMSTFGRLIVTQFQMNLKDKSVEFKAKEGHYLFKTKTKEADPGKKKIVSAMNENLSFRNVLDMPCGKPKPSEKRPCISECMACPRPSPQQEDNNNGQPYMGNMQVGSLAQPPSECPPQCPTVQMQLPPMAPVSQNNYGGEMGSGQGQECHISCPTKPCPTGMNGTNRAPGMGFPQSGVCQLCGSCPPQACPACGQVPNQMAQMPMQMPGQLQMQTQQLHNASGEDYKAQNKNLSNQMGTPCNECDTNGNKNNTQVPDPPDCDYQEFGAEMGGNSLIIRVHKDSACVEDVKDGQLCCCDQGGKPKQAVYAVSQPSSCPCSNQASVGVATGQKDGICPDCCPDNKTPFTFKMGGTTQADNKISVLSPTNNAENGGKLGNLADPTKEVFILRIGKKNESSTKKNCMEIELCTPRGKDYKPPNPKVDADMQCEPQEEPTKKDKGGGKKEKGKGKGKKK